MSAPPNSFKTFKGLPRANFDPWASDAFLARSIATMQHGRAIRRHVAAIAKPFDVLLPAMTVGAEALEPASPERIDVAGGNSKGPSKAVIDTDLGLPRTDA